MILFEGITLTGDAFFIMKKLVAALFDRFKLFPITRDQLTMLLEGNTCDSLNLFSDFDIQPIDFNSKNLSYLRKK